MSNAGADLLHLLAIRWVTLLHVALLYMLGMSTGSPLLFLALIFYCLLLTLLWQRATDVIKRFPLLIGIDLTLSGISMWLTGGTWQSPYFLYAFTSLLIAALFFHVRGGVAAAGYFSILYTVGLAINGNAVARIVAHNDLDTLISNYFAFFLVAVFFGYPAYIISQVEKAQNDSAQAQERLHEAKELLAATAKSAPLSPRELEILSCLSEGKTSPQIAEELHLSAKTVKNHLYRIYKKLGISSRKEAILYFNKLNSTDNKNS
ncbi:MAG TPA: LuxR C-terminal-related transcriptional regulator [Anaerolineae bacterium]|nr:LuxR C-terminal-related transcriptional regulator [Anaerolineae bacterium]